MSAASCSGVAFAFKFARFALALPAQRRPISTRILEPIGTPNAPRLPWLMAIHKLGIRGQPVATHRARAGLPGDRQNQRLAVSLEWRRFDFATAALYLRFFSL